MSNKTPKYKVGDQLYHDDYDFIIEIIGIDILDNEYEGKVITDIGKVRIHQAGDELYWDMDDVDSEEGIKLWNTKAVNTTNANKNQIDFDREAPTDSYSDAFDIIKSMF